MPDPRPSVSIVVPCRNEAYFIEKCVNDLRSQEYPPLEILIAEGASTDGTREKLTELTRDGRIRLIDNPGGLIPVGLNKAIRAANGEIILRADVHTRYESDYVGECVKALMRSGADNVGGPWIAAGEGLVQSAIACAFQSAFSCGGARSHSTEYEGPVDSVFLGCWRTDTIIKLGLYDEEFLRSEDDELNLRITRAGGVVWQTPRIRSTYLPRATIRGLFAQYFQWGYWKVRVVQKHQLPASWRHLVPAIAVLLAAVLVAFAPVSFIARTVLAVSAVAYAAATVLASAIACASQKRWGTFLLLPAVFPVFHAAYGLGFLKGILDFAILRKRPAASMTRVTR